MKTNENLTLIETYHDEANAKPWYSYQVDQFNQKQGEYKWWRVNGQIGIITIYKEGEYHGKYQRWWNNGRRWYIETHHFKKRYHGTKIIFRYE